MKIILSDGSVKEYKNSDPEAVELLAGMGQTLKVEHLNDGLAEEKTVSFYRQGEFLDLCRGPHILLPSNASHRCYCSFV
jgi:threonyl-tRNA synthetase